MAILTASNLGQSFGSLDVFSGITVSIPNDGKIGLVGPNGVGKTSLLLTLSGLSEPYAGEVHRARGKRIGYLPQEATQAFAGRNNTVYSELLTVFTDLLKEETQLREMEALMATADPSPKLMARYGSALEHFERAGGYEYEIRIKQVLEGLGFTQQRWELKLDHLSGGQKTRILLGRLLLEKPDLLILDEPTNHLDVDAMAWLETTLNTWEGAVLLVSHDRYFLDRVVSTIWEMGHNHLESYRGNYSAYIHQRRERWQQRQRAFDAQKERLEKELDYIRRNIAGQRTQMAKGKLSRISRELDAIQRGGLEAAKSKRWSETSQTVGASRHSMSVAEAAAAIKQLQRPAGATQNFEVRMQSGRRSGQIILRTNDLEIGYPDKTLFIADDIELLRLECAALIGPNGAGKTTFLRTILGELEPLNGRIKLGASLEVGYFAQAHEGLNPENSVIEELMAHNNMMISQARSYLARYLFSEDDVFKPVEALSGGERGRLALAILALEGANCLLLDEPTNHLDIPAQEMLQEVLEHFEGTILLVSHDRYLIDRLATQIWHLHNNRLEVFNGNYHEYSAAQELRANKNRLVEPAKEKQSRPRARKVPSVANVVKARAERLLQVEAEVARLESDLEQIGRNIQKASEADAFDKIQSLSIEYAAAENQLEKLMLEWENLAREQTLAA
jgi:ATP-binding cassette subfamily F protein 3